MSEKVPPGRKQACSFADMARMEAGSGIASAEALPGPEDLDRYERLCNALLARLDMLYSLESWKVEIWRRKRLLLESYSEIQQYLRGQGIRIVERTAIRAKVEVDASAKIIMKEMIGGRNAR